MKKQVTTILLIFAFLLTMAGCSAARAVQRLDAAEDMVEAKLEVAEEKMESGLRNAVSPAPAAAPTDPTPELPATLPLPTSPAADVAKTLTEEQAQQIALEYLGLAADQVLRLRSSYEIDDGIPQFNVEFYQGDWEYEFEIRAENGQILSYDKDHKYD